LTGKAGAAKKQKSKSDSHSKERRPFSILVSTCESNFWAASTDINNLRIFPLSTSTLQRIFTFKGPPLTLTMTRWEKNKHQQHVGNENNIQIGTDKMNDLVIGKASASTGAYSNKNLPYKGGEKEVWKQRDGSNLKQDKGHLLARIIFASRKWRTTCYLAPTAKEACQRVLPLHCPLRRQRTEPHGLTGRWGSACQPV
jgi:hypothetical protein